MSPPLGVAGFMGPRRLGSPDIKLHGPDGREVVVRIGEPRSVYGVGDLIRSYGIDPVLLASPTFWRQNVLDELLAADRERWP